MMETAVGLPRSLGARRFTMLDQRKFAAVSGDYNPMHMDALAARRTPAGAAVVHGVQSMLWALERLAEVADVSALRALDADFSQFLYVDEEVALTLVKMAPQEIRAELRVNEIRISQYVMKFGDRATAEAAVTGGGGITYAATDEVPLPLSWDEVAAAGGTVDYYAPDEAAAKIWPRLADAIGAYRVTSILSLTLLVGMVSPGLHSTFHRINIQLADEAPGRLGALKFWNKLVEPRFAVVTVSVRADGVAGTIKASRRQPPTRQASTAELGTLLAPDTFAGHVALIVGGSRGLGEITAKLLAAGGAETIITYASGQADAEAVAADITGAGGKAMVHAYDASLPAAPQLQGFSTPPGSLYFFATPRISSRALPAFSQELFHRFTRFYVNAFHDICLTLATSGHKLKAFYPSTIFVQEPTKSMAEYAMAKAAGEVLAADMTRFMPGVEVDVVRLPRLPTDQTASMIETAMGSAAETMLPIIRRVEGM